MTSLGNIVYMGKMPIKTLSQTTFLTARCLLLQLVSTHQGPFSSKAVINDNKLQ